MRDELIYGRPELEQDEGEVIVRAYTTDVKGVIAFTVKRNCVLTTELSADSPIQTKRITRDEHNAFRPTGPRVRESDAHPVLEKMARALAVVDGVDPDDHWRDLDNMNNDDGGLAWTYYTQHAAAALKTLKGLDEATLMAATGVFNYDGADNCPLDAPGDEDYAADLGEVFDHFVNVVLDRAPVA